MSQLENIKSKLEIFLKTHYPTLKEYQQILKELDTAFFNYYCLKSNIESCEFIHCAFYRNQCEYHPKLTDFLNELQQKFPDIDIKF